jgi:hypothetical protein
MRRDGTEENTSKRGLSKLWEYQWGPGKMKYSLRKQKTNPKKLCFCWHEQALSYTSDPRDTIMAASPTLLPITSQRPSDHDQEPLQVNIQEIRIMHVVYILEVAAEIVFARCKRNKCNLPLKFCYSMDSFPGQIWSYILLLMLLLQQ